MRSPRTILAGGVVAAVLLVAAPAAQATTPVSTNPREALVFIANLEQGDALQRAFYDFVEFNARGLAQTALGLRYRRVRVVEGSAATRSRLVSELDAMTASPTIRAVDLIFVTHGLDPSAVMFSNGESQMTSVRTSIQNALTQTQENRLRMVFSTACFGQGHRTAWREAGFNVVSGSRLIFADAATSYPAFLTAWGAGTTFASAVSAANAADPLRVSDNAAKLLLGRQDVDSTRVTSGSTGLKISTQP